MTLRMRLAALTVSVTLAASLGACSSSSDSSGPAASNSTSPTSSAASRPSATGTPTLGGQPTSISVDKLQAKTTSSSQSGEVLKATIVTAPIVKKFTRIVPGGAEQPCTITNVTKLPTAQGSAQTSTRAYSIECTGKKDKNKAWIAVKFDTTTKTPFAVQVAAKP